MCLQHEQTVLWWREAEHQWSFAPQDGQGPGGSAFGIERFEGTLIMLTELRVWTFASFPAASIFYAIEIALSRVRSFSESSLLAIFSSRRPNTKPVHKASGNTLLEFDKLKPFYVRRKCSQQDSAMVFESSSKNGIVLQVLYYFVQNMQLAFWTNRHSWRFQVFKEM